jgi:hypothetical protein
MRRAILILAAAAVVAGPAQAQLFGRGKAKAGPPPGTPPAEAEIWPFPPPDPQTWWDDKWPRGDEAADPLGGRRLPRGQRAPVIEGAADASTYRLWGLMPLQWQLLRGDETIVEVWVRPSRNVRQSIVRVTFREDGKAFLQARAGYACCEAGIGRRVGFDVELPAEQAEPLHALRDSAIWRSPREVESVKNASTTDIVCVSGVGYDLTLVTSRGSKTLHRACDDIAVGQAAEVLEPVLKAALGHEPRFDILFRNKIDFSLERQAYADFTAGGGVLKAAPNRTPPPGLEPSPETAP